MSPGSSLYQRKKKQEGRKNKWWHSHMVTKRFFERGMRENKKKTGDESDGPGPIQLLRTRFFFGGSAKPWIRMMAIACTIPVIK